MSYEKVSFKLRSHERMNDDDMESARSIMYEEEHIKTEEPS